MRDMRDDPKFLRWAAEARRELQKLDESALTMALITPAALDSLDIQQALELGASLLLGKPLLLCVTAGAKVPPGLAKAADEIVEVDEPISSPANQERLQDALRRMGVGSSDE